MFLTIEEVAKKAFNKGIREQIEWLSDKVWLCNIPSDVVKINEMICAAQFLKGIGTDVRELSEEEVAELVTTLTALRTLKMKDQIRELLTVTLFKCGITIAEEEGGAL